MMSDQDVEARLGRYRPSGPSRALRSRVVRERRSLTWQLAAAAAFLAAAIVLRSGTSRLDREIAATSGADAVRAAEQAYADELTHDLGDDPSVRSLAELVITNERRQAAASQGFPQ